MTNCKICGNEHCEFCGEAEGTEKIANPNLDMGSDIDWKAKDSWWMVCKPCKEFIHLQKMRGFAEMVGDTRMMEIYDTKLKNIPNVEKLKTVKK
jgi:hypothetical protein